MGIANLLTSLRILLIPLFILVFYLPFPGMHVLTAVLFSIGALTDWLDGYLARSLRQVSRLGTFLDPVADKLMVVTSLILLIGERHLPGLALPGLIVICREITVSALREWMAEIGEPTTLAVSKLGKIKTAIQMLSITLLLLYQPGISSRGWGVAGYLLFYLAALLTLWSMAIYLRAAWWKLKKVKEHSTSR